MPSQFAVNLMKPALVCEFPPCDITRLCLVLLKAFERLNKLPEFRGAPMMVRKHLLYLRMKKYVRGRQNLFIRGVLSFNSSGWSRAEHWYGRRVLLVSGEYTKEIIIPRGFH